MDHRYDDPYISEQPDPRIVAASKTGKKLAVASFIFSMVSLSLFLLYLFISKLGLLGVSQWDEFIVYINILANAVLASALGIIFGAVSIKKQKTRKALSIIGMIISIVSTVISTLYIVILGLSVL